MQYAAIIFVYFSVLTVYNAFEKTESKVREYH